MFATHLSRIFSFMFVFSMAGSAFAASIPEKSFNAPHNMKLSVKEIGPVTQNADLQIILLLKHNSNGDQYIEAMSDFNQKLGKLLSSLRERGEFVGELGETLLFTPPAHSITPKKVLLIGIGDEKDLSLEKLRVAGRIAAREAVRLQAKQVSFAPTLRDQGSNVIDVGDGDAAVSEQVILAYDTEKRLQAEKLAPQFDIKEWTIEAGPKYFDAAATKVGEAVKSATAEIEKREKKPYMSKN
ncbi:MAG: peptidase M17 [Gammaproteobacteria bacterium 39-13]|nr:MAG: peptidase M17 [Gammaproteobacteria bacterium 39-13]